MVSGLEDDQVFFADQVNEAVLFTDAARPCPGENVLEGLWLADASSGVAQGLIDESVDARQCLAVRTQPVGVVLPTMWGETSLTG